MLLISRPKVSECASNVAYLTGRTCKLVYDRRIQFQGWGVLKFKEGLDLSASAKNYSKVDIRKVCVNHFPYVFTGKVGIFTKIG